MDTEKEAVPLLPACFPLMTGDKWAKDEIHHINRRLLYTSSYLGMHFFAAKYYTFCLWDLQCQNGCHNESPPKNNQHTISESSMPTEVENFTACHQIRGSSSLYTTPKTSANPPLSPPTTPLGLLSGTAEAAPIYIIMPPAPPGPISSQNSGTSAPLTIFLVTPSLFRVTSRHNPPELPSLLIAKAKAVVTISSASSLLNPSLRQRWTAVETSPK